MVEISSDDDLVEMSVAASLESSSVSVFTHCSRLLPLRSVVLAILLDHYQSTPQKANLNNIQAADVIQRARECLNAQVHSPVHGPVQSPQSRFCSVPVDTAHGAERRNGIRNS